MLLLQNKDIKEMGITTKQCLKWIEESFSIKYEAQLPPKSSLHPQGHDFFNTMPCLLPTCYGRFCVKEVHRIAGQIPTLGSDLLLYDSRTGELLAMMDADWITTMRTGAVVTLTCRLLQKSDVKNYSFIGLGNTARAAALCLIEDNKGKDLLFRLLRYKDQAELFQERFKDFPNVSFEIVDTTRELAGGADVIISCLTDAKELICEDADVYKPGILIIPVHTKGFQNCDLAFDKVFGDDTGHIQGFKYFKQFKQFHELSEVLLGKAAGRESEAERILDYNIGLGLHDALFASKIFDGADQSRYPQIHLERETEKFWI